MVACLAVSRRVVAAVRPVALAVVALVAAAAMLPAQDFDTTGAPTGAGPLTRIPLAATYAWVAPSVVFAGAGPKDDKSVRSRGHRSVQDDVNTVLRTQGWREVAPESAMFVLAMRQSESLRPGEETVQRPVREEPQVLVRRECDAMGNCRDVTVPNPRYDPHGALSVSERRTAAVAVRRLELTMVRTADAAYAAWHLGAEPGEVARRGAAKAVLALLLAGTR